MAQFTTTESTGDSTSTSSTPADKVVHTVTSPTGRKYIIFFSCNFTVANLATRCKVDLKIDGVQVATFSPRFAATAEEHNVFFFEQVTGKTASFDCEIEFSSTNNSNIATIRNARIVAWDYTDIEGSLDIRYAADNNNVGLTTTYDDGASVAFTPGTTGNYFILGCAGVAPGSTTAEALARLDIDGTFLPFLTDTVVYWGVEAAAAVTDAFFNFCMGTRKSLDNTSHTIKVSAASESGNVGTWQYSRVLAFREDAFTSSNYAESDTAAEDANATTTFETRATVTTTDPGVASKDYLVLAGGSVGQSGDTFEAERSEQNIEIDNVQQIVMEHRAKDLTDHLSLGGAIMKSTDAAFTVDYAHRLQAPCDNASQSKNSWIIILRDDVVVGGAAVKTLPILGAGPG